MRLIMSICFASDQLQIYSHAHRLAGSLDLSAHPGCMLPSHARVGPGGVAWHAHASTPNTI